MWYALYVNALTVDTIYNLVKYVKLLKIINKYSFTFYNLIFYLLIVCAKKTFKI